jgi:uncharacterized protein with LGFP repeats
VTRAGWGADETIRESGNPDYSDTVKVVIVHHTDTAAAYSCADSASIVRGIYAYHVKTRGWRDIGYNFLVDKCGTIFEGRYGGMAKAVLGAHTYGFNYRTTGVAVLGTYQTIDGVAPTPVTSKMTGSVAALAAWKLGLYGVSPSGSTTLTEAASDSYGYTKGASYTFKRISGHRDGMATACPGTNLYNKLPSIRTYAAGPPAVPAVTALSGATASGSSYYTKGAVTVSWKTSTPYAVLKRFEILVDGKVAATAKRTATSAAVTLPAGSHTVRVRAVHINATTRSSAAYTVVGDTAKPAFSTAPAVRTRTGTVSTGAVPVTLTWKATDNTVLKNTRATAPATATFGPTVTSWATTAKPGISTAFALRATDMAGNHGTASVTRTASIVQETASVRSGKWTVKSSSSYLGGKSLSSKSKGAALTWTFTGRSVAWVVSRASTSGKAYIYLDGARVATVDLKAGTAKYRQAIWTKTWSGSAAKHKLKIVVVGTSGRPTVTTDGITIVK